MKAATVANLHLILDVASIIGKIFILTFLHCLSWILVTCGYYAIVT